MKKILALMLSMVILLTSNTFVFADVTNESMTESVEKDNSIITYLTIADPSVSKGQKVDIVIGIDENSSVTSAKLCVKNTDLNKEYYIDGSITEEGNLLFESAQLESGCYSVLSIEYIIDGVTYTQLLDELDMDVQFGVDTIVIDSDPDGIVTDNTDDEQDENSVVVDNGENLNDKIDSAIEYSLDDIQTPALYAASNNITTIVLDPGHGGKDGGATYSYNGKTYLEKNLNLKIAQYCKNELETYSGVRVYMTRNDDTFVELEDRVNYAKSVGATVFVSIHNNSSSNRSVHGAAVYYPNGNYRPSAGAEGEKLAKSIVSQLAALGLKSYGAIIRNSECGDTYEDGSLCDYYSVIRNSKKAGFPGIIIEHAYVSNASDVANYLGSDAALKKLGVADANGIVNYFGLTHAVPGTEYKGVNYQLIFDPDYYMNKYPDVKAAVGGKAQKALEHFVTYGMKEGRRGNEIFDVNYYKNKYTDLQNAYGNNLASYYMHYMSNGVFEGRQACQEFDVISYRARYADLRKAFGNNLKSYVMHYITNGKKEGRNGSKDTNIYNVQFIQNGEVIENQQVEFGHAAKTPENIYKKNGATVVYDKSFDIITADTVVTVENKYLYNGKDYTAIFDGDYYLNNYSDLKNAFGNDGSKAFSHFITNGMKEGRKGNDTFDVYSYKGRYADLQSAFGNNLKAYFMHYLDYGIKEKRDASERTDLYTVKFMDGDKVVSEQKVRYGHPATAPNIASNGASISWNEKYDCITKDTIVKLVRKYIYKGTDYSDIFDADYYLNKYADLKRTFGNDGNKAFNHFITCGMREGRQAKATFNVISYKNRYLDLRQAFGSDLKKYYMHYITYGKKENRITTGFEKELVNAKTVYNGINYSSVYDFNYYISKNPDVFRAFGYDENKVLEHFVTCGMKEGRESKSTFNMKVYKANYADLRNAYGNNNKAYYIHYINYGQKEKRKAI